MHYHNVMVVILFVSIGIYNKSRWRTWSRRSKLSYSVSMLLSFYLALILIFHLEWPHLYSIAYEVFGSGAKLIGNSLKAP